MRNTTMTHATRRTRLFLLFLNILLLAVPAVVLADELPNPLGGVNTLQGLLIRVGQGLVGLMAVAATFMFIYGGVMMLTSGGNEKRVKQATDTLKWTFIGVIIIMLSAAIIQFVLSGLGYTGEKVPAASLGLGTNDLVAATVNVVRFILGVLGVFALVQVIWGGYQWLISAGNEEMIKKAKANIRAAIIGIFIIMLSWTLIKYAIFLGNLFSGATPPATQTEQGP